MFRRRAALPLSEKIAGLFWPRMGWQRLAAYYWRRLQRIPGTPEGIAAGFACGAAASMTPLMGFHFLLSALLAWMLRGSILASAFGTVVGNPWTFPFIWAGTYRLGHFMLGLDSDPERKLNFVQVFTGLTRSVAEGNGTLFLENVWPVWWPMLAGSVPVAAVSGAVTYALLAPPLRTFHLLRQQRRASRAAARGL